MTILLVLMCFGMFLVFTESYEGHQCKNDNQCNWPKGRCRIDDQYPKCEDCIICKSGEGKTDDCSHIYPIQLKRECQCEAGCAPCKDGWYAINGENGPCHECHICDILGRVTTQPCTSEKPSECGACKDPLFCRHLSTEPGKLKEFCESCHEGDTDPCCDEVRRRITTRPTKPPTSTKSPEPTSKGTPAGMSTVFGIAFGTLGAVIIFIFLIILGACREKIKKKIKSIRRERDNRRNKVPNGRGTPNNDGSEVSEVLVDINGAPRTPRRVPNLEDDVVSD